MTDTERLLQLAHSDNTNDQQLTGLIAGVLHTEAKEIENKISNSIKDQKL